MDRNATLRNLAEVQNRVDYAQKAGRLLWSRTAQDAGRETLDMALQTIRTLDEASRMLNHLVGQGAFGH